MLSLTCPRYLKLHDYFELQIVPFSRVSRINLMDLVELAKTIDM